MIPAVFVTRTRGEDIITEFPDVTDSSKACYKPVYWAVGSGIIKGYQNGCFGPEDSCTREQFVVMIWRLNGKPQAESEVSFTDVDSSRSTYKAMQWAVEQGIIKGFSDGSFRPEDKVTREQVAIMLWRMAGRPDTEESDQIFTDVPRTATGYEAIMWGAARGIIRGYSDGTFRSGERCQRQHAAVFLYRYSRWEDESKEKQQEEQKVIYLTFDDGPGPYTQNLLGILEEYDVKATFFVTARYGDALPLIAREAQEGHSVAVHTFSHDYEKLYSSERGFWQDFDSMNNIIEQYTGKRADFFRFAGGSSNTISSSYNSGIMSRLTAQATARGLQYYDWDASGGDGGGTTDPDQVVRNVIEGIEDMDTAVVLLHDPKPYTIQAVPEILEYCLENGYTFLPLEKDSVVCHHEVEN